MSFLREWQRQREFFLRGESRSYSFRLAALRKLKRAVKTNEAAILHALHLDLRKPKMEAYAGELAPFYDEVEIAIKNLKKWMKPVRARTPIYKIAHLFGKSMVCKEPYGCVLILGPWNYPFNLVLLPLIAAVAAGNTVVLKPSELAHHSSQLLASIIQKNFDPSFIHVIEGDAKVSAQLLNIKWDKIFFTGGIEVGKIVMKAAAEHLTPVTLELGGKSPCILDEKVDLKVAAKRIVWGKFFNAGQTCVAPDYLLAPRKFQDEIVRELKSNIQKFYGAEPKRSADFSRIISEKHFDRLISYFDSGELLHGGQSDRAELFIEPTVLKVVDHKSKIMEEEIFGPILPIVFYETIDEAFQIVRSKDKPLALYCFTSNKKLKDRIVRELSAGGICINDTLVHLTNSSLPFGGVGPSGHGRYHGKFGFDEFSHSKAVEKKPFVLDSRLRYPPYKLPLNRFIKKFI